MERRLTNGRGGVKATPGWSRPPVVSSGSAVPATSGRESRVGQSPIKSWIGLASLIEGTSSGKWIFRGETQLSYTLRPKAGRVGTERGAARKKPYDLAHEREALVLFKRLARPHLGHTPSSELEWLVIAQHHGMSTRLLDWTESLLVAAYFAVEKAGTTGDAVIYGVQGLRVITKSEEKRPFDLRSSGIYRPAHVEPRIQAQRSVFTVHPNPTVPFSPNGLSRWVITSSACGSIKRILDTCGINESLLFPDLDAVSRYVGWRYKWGKL